MRDDRFAPRFLSAVCGILLAFGAGGTALAQNPFEPLPEGGPGDFSRPGNVDVAEPAPDVIEAPTADPDGEPTAVPGATGVAAGESFTDEPYRLQPGDAIEVQVLEDPSLNRALNLQPDGLISFPLAGAVVAGGKTPAELADDIRDALSDDFLDPPTVTVTLVGIAGRAQAGLTFYIFGQVGRPGRYEIREPVDVLQALAMAGGPSIFAATTRIQVRKRDEAGTEQLSFFDFDAVTEGLAVPFPQEIDDGDVIYVPEAGLFE